MNSGESAEPEQQKNQRAEKTKHRTLEQTHDIQLAEKLSTMTTKLEEDIDNNQKLGELTESSDSANETP